MADEEAWRDLALLALTWPTCLQCDLGKVLNFARQNMPGVHVALCDYIQVLGATRTRSLVQSAMHAPEGLCPGRPAARPGPQTSSDATI